MKAIISIAALAMTFASVLAQELRGGPAVLSDVTPADANSGDILKESDNTKLIGEGRKHYRNNFQQQPYDSKQDPCEWERVLMNDCVNSNYNPSFPDAAEKHALCLGCIQDAWDEVPVGTSCTSLKEIGFCDDVISCEQLCMGECSAQTHDLLRCTVVHDGCDGPTFDSECLSAIDIILDHQVLSDVTPADANSEGHEWHPKADFVSDILKENGKANLVGEGQYKHYHKTKLIANILKDSNNTKQDPCEWEREVMNDCLEDFPWTPDPDEHALCLDCLDDAWNDVAIGTTCDSLKEIGFCEIVTRCEDRWCNYMCVDVTHDLLRCVAIHDGCNGSTFDSECPLYPPSTMD
ncbi:hypothetical protein ACHAW5_006685 [Stephanodiscus triporus]|uniref:Uncharacterized protein n=1 Tax=Stephanodiscus triporus TaxID=2934178 RepID=A0ABD3MDF4_9STRA